MAKKKGHHGGAWKVAYADFTTAMMALFLCLWLTAQDTKIKENTVRLELTRDGLRVNVFDRSQKPVFEPGTDRFTPYGEWVFSTLAWEIARYQSFKIELEGHTTRAAPQERETLRQWELSTERANAARRQLVQHGVLPTQICKVSGFADTMPMPDLPPDSEANRRVTILLRLKETAEALSAANSSALSHATLVQ